MLTFSLNFDNNTFKDVWSLFSKISASRQAISDIQRSQFIVILTSFVQRLCYLIENTLFKIKL